MMFFENSIHLFQDSSRKQPAQDGAILRRHLPKEETVINTFEVKTDRLRPYDSGIRFPRQGTKVTYYSCLNSQLWMNSRTNRTASVPFE
jgi:hypothetical protein